MYLTTVRHDFCSIHMEGSRTTHAAVRPLLVKPLIFVEYFAHDSIYAFLALTDQGAHVSHISRKIAHVWSFFAMFYRLFLAYYMQSSIQSATTFSIFFTRFTSEGDA